MPLRPCWFAAPLLAVLAGTGSAADAPAGAALYKAKCASCHGPAGEGTKKYSSRLEGNQSPAQLADVIRKTMPEDAPESLSAAEATAVAGYVHAAFYSPVARERNRPARIELARLTAVQHRNALADVVGSFRPTNGWNSDRGLRAEYFKARGMGGGNRVLERTDPQVAFDFGTESAVPGKTEPGEFSIRWNGSLLAPETGEYGFTVCTEHATRLWVNDNARPLIDAWVKSGTDTEYTGRVFLVGGRAYPLRLEYSKAKQGVDDSKDKKKNPPKPVKSSVALLWTLPHRPPEVVPARHLSPVGSSVGFACATPFPPDDRSYGWERGTTVSKEWDQAATDAALETAGYVAANLNELAGVKAPGKRPTPPSGNPAAINLDGPAGPKDPDAERPKKLRQFAGLFAERAFRRPLTADQTAVIDRQFAAAADPELAVKRVVLWALKSPRFLYREVGDAADAFDMAARLAFALWDAGPDAELLKAAAAGQLTTREQVEAQAKRMLAHPAGRAKLRGFLLTWLKATGGHDLAKDPKLFPGFDPAAIADLRTSLELGLDDVVWSDAADFRRLVQGDDVFLNGRLAKFYGIDRPANAGFEKAALDAGKRAGVLTHPYLLATFASAAESSPIHRGVFLARGLLGVTLKPPPEAVAPLAADLHPKLTTRERVTLQTGAAACVTCHRVINPLGFTLENFDAVGRFRVKDRDKPVDPAGSYQTRAGDTAAISGAKELGAFLANSPDAHAAFCEQMFHSFAQQSVRAYGADTADSLRKRFTAGGFNVRSLAVDVAATAALKPRDAVVARAP